MANSWFSCKACSESDPVQDTVKVNPDLLNKENVQPLQFAKDKVDEQRKREAAEAAERRRKEEAAAAAVAEAARLREEVERAAAEKARRQEIARREAEEAARREAEERAREERAAAEARAAAAAAAAAVAAEEERQREEAKKQAEEEQERLRQEALQKATEWAKSNGYPDINTSKKTFRGATKYPLHTAVKYVNKDMVGLLLRAGAQKDVKDSKDVTPCQLAEKLNKSGSHGDIIAMLL